MNTPEPQIEEEQVPQPASPERALLFWFLTLLSLSAAGLLWLSIRSSSPESIQKAMDVLIYASLGAAIAYAAFRTLFFYPFHLLELLVIVLILSLGMHQTVIALNGLKTFGLMETGVADPGHFGQVFQVCLLVSSVLLVGAALGLRNCYVLKIEATLPRLLVVAAGTLALPAAAGMAAFPAVILLDLLAPAGYSAETPVYFLLWILCFVITWNNAALFIRSLAIRAEIDAKEKMP